MKKAVKKKKKKKRACRRGCPKQPEYQVKQDANDNIHQTRDFLHCLVRTSLFPHSQATQAHRLYPLSFFLSFSPLDTSSPRHGTKARIIPWYRIMKTSPSTALLLSHEPCENDRGCQKISVIDSNQVLEKSKNPKTKQENQPA